MRYEVSDEQFETVNVLAENRMIDGENTLRVVKGPEKLMRFDENTYARLKDLTFHLSESHSGSARTILSSSLFTSGPPTP